MTIWWHEAPPGDVAAHSCQDDTGGGVTVTARSVHGDAVLLTTAAVLAS